MEAQLDTMAQDTQDVMTRSPRTHINSDPIPTDSMVTVPLTEAATDDGHTTDGEDEGEEMYLPQTPRITLGGNRLSSRPTSAEIMQAIREPRDSGASTDSRTNSLPDDDAPHSPQTRGRSRNSSDSDQSENVDWAELEKKEEQETQEEGQDEAMALLLARLEQENNALTADPKARLKSQRTRSMSRPPSMNQLRRLVGERDPSQVRLSQLPSPPPMTELEFWAALVRDYSQTVHRLPTLTLNKIRGGIPAPLRGVVWQSASGARDKLIEDQYDNLCGESSPYENIINKDLGRSFPGVDMFKDPEGEGQKMLGRVLKCFSLYDHKIGYCQGLGFLVGPLLMQMGDKEAFCVLVRLMEDYDLRSCFLPDLSGLHLRIFQFQRLLHQHMPKVAAHLDSLGVESAYLSQWFLSFFAVTCPLPMLFRIYDVVFAEGASETLMRVALALMKRNEQKILALSEFEDVMQLLLGRSLWDPYGRNAKSADELVNDFVNFTNDVTRESLQGLEAAFKESQKDGSSKEVQKSATSFLGRLWPISNSSTKSVTLSPGLSAPSRPVSFLRRTPSKQSLASTMISEQGSDSSTNTQSTALTDLSRGSSGDALSLKSGHESVALSLRMGASAKDRDLHYQIEQLLMSVSQLQRQNSEIEAALQKAREERKEDHRIVRTVISKMRNNKQTSLSTPSPKEGRRRTTITSTTPTTPLIESSPAQLPEETSEALDQLESRFPATQTHHRASSMFETKALLKENLSRTKDLLSSETIRANTLARDLVDAQADLQNAREALRETRSRLQDSYNTNQKHEKIIQELRQQSRKASVPWIGGGGGTVIFNSNGNGSLNEGGGGGGMGEGRPELARSSTTDSTSSSSNTTGPTGLREFRLGRSTSNKSSSQRTITNSSPTSHSPTTRDSSHNSYNQPQQQFSKRTSSLAIQQVLSTEKNECVDNEALLLELVNAKTAEAVARQELEELRGRFEGLRRGLGVATPNAAVTGYALGGTSGSKSSGNTPLATPPISAGPGSAASAGTNSAGSGVGGFWSGWKRSVSTSNVNVPS